LRFREVGFGEDTGDKYVSMELEVDSLFLLARDGESRAFSWKWGNGMGGAKMLFMIGST
jgi:hypothetical protein